MTDLYKKALSRRLRFETSRGQVTVEDLFTLPLTSSTGRPNLNDIAKALYHKLKNDDAVDFVGGSTTESESAFALDVVKDVIEFKKAERAAEQARADKAATKQKIMALIDQKKDAALGAASIEELQAQLDNL